MVFDKQEPPLDDEHHAKPKTAGASKLMQSAMLAGAVLLVCALIYFTY